MAKEVPPGEAVTISAGRSTTSTVLIIMTCFMATSLNTLMISSSNISLSSIGRSLHIPPGSLEWVASAYSLSAGCFLLLCGRLADLYGRKRVFLAGAIWMSILGVGCGLSHTTKQLLIFRGLQGIGSAACITGAIGVLAQSFPPGRTRSIGFATFSAGAPFGGAIGYNIGGLITQFSPIGWRGVFFLGAGLTSLTFLIGLFSIDHDKPSTEPDKRVDWIGAALVTIGLVLITFVLGEGELAPQGWRTPCTYTHTHPLSNKSATRFRSMALLDIAAFLVLGISLVVAFLFWERFLDRHSTRPPLVRLGIFTRARGKFAAILLIAFLQWCAFISWQLWVQLYYQTYKNYTPTQTMLRLVPASVTGLTLNFIVGVVVGWIPAIYLLVIGTVATGTACLLFATINVDAPYWAFAFPSTILIVWGADFIFSCGSLFVSRVALPHEQSVAGGIFATFIQLGTSFGLAITTTVHNTVVRNEILRPGIVPGAPPPPAQAQSAELAGYRAAQWTGFGFALSALVISLLLFRGVGIIGGREVNLLKDESEPNPLEKEKTNEQSETP